MWVYQSFEPGLFTVGFYTPDGEWVSESDHSDRDCAAGRVNFLNGGTLIQQLAVHDDGDPDDDDDEDDRAGEEWRDGSGAGFDDEDD